MSRTAALNSNTKCIERWATKHGVKLLGGALDEAPFAYKDIEEVMRAKNIWWMLSENSFLKL
jgi:tRNA-splicing ligase RtcB (3'-phosphate/5'-hydroxy nucleic acid ligase)